MRSVSVQFVNLRKGLIPFVPHGFHINPAALAGVGVLERCLYCEMNARIEQALLER